MSGTPIVVISPMPLNTPINAPASVVFQPRSTNAFGSHDTIP